MIPILWSRSGKVRRIGDLLVLGPWQPAWPRERRPTVAGEPRTIASSQPHTVHVVPLPVPISEYGLIGDTRTAALVSSRGSIDWLCVPRFDSQPVFGRLLDAERGGSFEMGPASTAARMTARRYLPDSTTLETTWTLDGSELTLTEGMPAELGSDLLPRSLLVRRLECYGRPAPVRIRFDPQGGWGRRPSQSARRAGALVWSYGPIALALHTTPELHLAPGQEQILEIEPGRPLTAVVSLDSHTPMVHVPPAHGWQLLQQDRSWWQHWCGGVDEGIPFREPVVRSLMTLRLLTYSPSGAPVAAPTSSLPEQMGGSRNWDYRYAWPRDASIGIGAFLAAGKHEEARSFLYWLLHASRLTRPRLPPLLTVFGCPVPAERELDSWPGYADSRPVRVGNAAADQHQLDVYGWVLDAAWVLSANGYRLFGEVWRTLAGFADFVADRWRHPDAGLWEVRQEPRHFVHSKLMAWLALDRAVRLSDQYRTRGSRARWWSEQRNALATDIRAHGFDRDRGTYVRAYGSREADAALLLLPDLGFDPASSPAVTATIAAIRQDLAAGGPLLYRYPVGRDGVPGGEGAFLPCSFWLVRALARTGRVDEAVATFDQLLAYNSLGLFAEEVDPASGAQVGNFPQAFTHAALVQAALAIRDALAGPPGHGPRNVPSVTP